MSSFRTMLSAMALLQAVLGLGEGVGAVSPAGSVESGFKQRSEAVEWPRRSPEIAAVDLGGVTIKRLIREGRRFSRQLRWQGGISGRATVGHKHLVGFEVVTETAFMDAIVIRPSNPCVVWRVSD